MQAQAPSACIKNTETVNPNIPCCSKYSMSTTVSNPFTNQTIISSVCARSPYTPS